VLSVPPQRGWVRRAGANGCEGSAQLSWATAGQDSSSPPGPARGGSGRRRSWCVLESRGAGQPLAEAMGGRWVCAPSSARCCGVPFNDTRLMRRALVGVIRPGGTGGPSKSVCLYRSTPGPPKTPPPPRCLLPGWLRGGTNPSPFPNVP